MGPNIHWFIVKHKQGPQTEAKVHVLICSIAMNNVRLFYEEENRSPHKLIKSVNYLIWINLFTLVKIKIMKLRLNFLWIIYFHFCLLILIILHFCVIRLIRIGDRWLDDLILLLFRTIINVSRCIKQEFWIQVLENTHFYL